MYIFWLLLYGFIYITSGFLSRQLDRPYIFFVLFILLYWGAFLYILHRKGRWEMYGICLPKQFPVSSVRLSAAAFLFAAANLLSDGTVGLAEWTELRWIEAAARFLEITLLVWGEEVFFRGFLPEFLSDRIGQTPGQWGAILLFALMHLVNLVQGENRGYILLQTICAFVFGLLLWLLRSQSGSLLPGTILHMLVNLTAGTVTSSGSGTVMTAGQVIISLIAAGAGLAVSIYEGRTDRKIRN